MIWIETTLIIFGKIHFLSKSENEFFHEIKCDGITSFADFIRLYHEDQTRRGEAVVGS